MSTSVPSAGPPASTLRIAVDIGGTFTDAAAFDEASGELRLGKWSSTPRDLVEGSLLAIEQAGADLARASVVLHGSTVVINAILQRQGAETALITTRGFRDVYEIGRINRPESFNLFFRKHVPLVPRSRRYELEERLNAEARCWCRSTTPRPRPWHASWWSRASRASPWSSCTATATRPTSCGCATCCGPWRRTCS